LAPPAPWPSPPGGDEKALKEFLALFGGELLVEVVQLFQAKGRGFQQLAID
jgi:hypothetical protein